MYHRRLIWFFCLNSGLSKNFSDFFHVNLFFGENLPKLKIPPSFKDTLMINKNFDENEIKETLLNALLFECDPKVLEKLIKEYESYSFIRNAIKNLQKKLNRLKKEDEVIKILLDALANETSVQKLSEIIEQYKDMESYFIRLLIKELESKKYKLKPPAPIPVTISTYKP